MNKLLLPSLFLVSVSTAFAAPLNQSWIAQDGIETPESAYFDPTSKQIFVSSVAGAPDGKDGKGWISKLDTSGKVITAKWADRFHAPKGMRAQGGTLWVTNINEVVGVSIASGKITARHAIPGSRFLNDIAVTEAGVIYVSDTVTSTIHKIEGGRASILVQGEAFDHPNGLLLSGNELIVAAWGKKMKPDWSTAVAGHLYSLNLKTLKRKTITKKPLGHLDGLESDGKGGWYVSDWSAGKVYQVSAQGKTETLVEGIKNSADIGFIADTKTLLVPGMGENSVRAYQAR